MGRRVSEAAGEIRGIGGVNKYEQNAVYTCVKSSKNKLKIILKIKKLDLPIFTVILFLC